MASQRIPAPSLVLWAWERPEDLRGLGTSAGVAFLAQTIALDESIAVRPRRQPLHVDRSTALIAVTRIFQRLTRPLRTVREDSDIRVPSAPINTLLTRVVTSEARLARLIPMPIGSSLMVVARKIIPGSDTLNV